MVGGCKIIKCCHQIRFKCFRWAPELTILDHTLKCCIQFKFILVKTSVSFNQNNFQLLSISIFHQYYTFPHYESNFLCHQVQGFKCDHFWTARTLFRTSEFASHALRTHMCFLPGRTSHPHSHFRIVNMYLFLLVLTRGII